MYQIKKFEGLNKLDHNGKRTGRWKFYFDNGRLYSDGYYKNNERIGLIKYYHHTGKLIEEQIYIK